MKAIKNPGAKTIGNVMPKTLGHVDGVIENSAAVRKHGASVSTLKRIADAKRAEELENTRGPITGGVSISGATLAATRSMAPVVAAIAAGKRIELPLVEPVKDENKPGFLGRLAAKFGLNKKGRAA